MPSKVLRVKRQAALPPGSASEDNLPTLFLDPPGFSDEAASGFSTGKTASQTVPAIYQALELAKVLQHEAAARDIPGYQVSEMETYPGSGDLRFGSNLTYGSSSLEAYAPQTSFPRTLQKQLERVDYWVEHDELVERLISVKEEISVMGFTLRCSRRKQAEKINDTEKKALAVYRDRLDLIEKKWNWHAVVSDLLREWLSKDTMILYWKMEMPGTAVSGTVDAEGTAEPEPGSKEDLIPGLINLCALNPSDCDWQNSFGQDQLSYKINWQIERKIRDALALVSPQERTARIQALIDEGIEAKYIEAVVKNQKYVLLRKEDGDRWIIITRGNRQKGFRKPSMTNIFAPLEIRRFVADGDFAASFLVKHFIFHATQGESIDQGPLAGQRMNWAGKKEIEALHNMLKKTNKAAKVVTDHTVKFNFVFPPKEMWDTAKYEKAESRIYNWGGVTLVLMTGDGGTNASGFIGSKRIIANLANARKQIKLALFEFFDSAEIKAATGMPENCSVLPTFDENVLKDPKQLLDELRSMLDEGIHDPAMAIDELGRDSETIKDAKAAAIEENNSSQLWTPLNPKGNRQDSQATSGRPPNSGTSPSEATRLQSPTT